MKNIFSFVALSVAGLVLLSCSNYGKKINIEGTKGEIYYKDGATENDAKKVGDFLKADGFIGNVKGASVQVSKQADDYLLRFVYDKDYYEKTPGIEGFFKDYGVRMSKELFSGRRVDISLADKYFKDFKSIPYDSNAAKGSPGGGFTKDDFNHETVGDVNFYWKDISSDESKTIINYISQNGTFSGGTAEIYMTKQGDRIVLKFPVKEEYQNDAATIAQVEKVSKEIKDNVFANEPYSFQMTDAQLSSLRSFDY
ncbi:MAG TPA: hypothetical protein VK588_06880 [Chitinophagaceae bacterium]|nr:hypothetical protein [Chitinophagaceae bacterium]